MTLLSPIPPRDRETGLSVCRTLRADQDQWQVGRVPVVGEPAAVVINRLEADLVLQTEDEDHGVDPQSKLGRFKSNFINTQLETMTLLMTDRK